MTTTIRRVLAGGALGAALLTGGAVTAGSAQAADTGIPTLEAIKQCESGGSYTVVNASSGASGAYQFLDSTWQSLSASAGYASAASAPESVQDAAAIELYQAQGTTPWAASQSCWSGTVASTGSATASTGTASTAEAASTSTTASGTSTSGTSSAGSATSTSTAAQDTVQDTVQETPAAGSAPAVRPSGQARHADGGHDRAGAQEQGAQRPEAPAGTGAAGCPR